MWKTSQLLDDVQISMQMRPLTYTRKLSELWVGLCTIEAKWTSFENILSPDTYILGSVLPSEELIQQILQLPSDSALYWESQWIAFRASSPQSEHKQHIYLKEQPTFIQFPEELLEANSQALAYEIKPNTFDLKAFSELGNTCINFQNCYIDPSASITGSILDASLGPIFIGKNVTLQIGTYIQGPVAILADSVTNLGAKIRPFTTIGPGCKVGGEISASILFPYSNKSHEGFIGNSIIGSFCNLGALTTCSNVRNDLKSIHLYNYATNQQRDTGHKSFGILLGDYVTTGIHTKFNTGTVVGNHCNISGTQFLPKFIPSLTLSLIHI
jgi:acetyltransferase-like isoleucine patch superfamily enzyme